MNFEAKSSLSTLKNGGCYQITDNSYQITDNSYHDNTFEILEKYISQNFGVFVFSHVREKIKTVFFLGAMFVINNIKTNRNEKESSTQNNPSLSLFLKKCLLSCYQLSVISYLLSVICYQLSVITPHFGEQK